MRIYAPLSQGHPLIGRLGGCALCHEGFAAGQRTMLVPAREPQQGFEDVPAVPVHAKCALKGMKVSPILWDREETDTYSGPGVIDSIRDGDASPYPVVLEDGRQFKLEEVGLKGA